MKIKLKLLLSLLFCLLLSENLFADKITEVLLSNGMKVYIKPMRAAPVVTINYWVKNGSIYESEGEAGFSELISKLLFNSSLNYSNNTLINEINKMGLKLTKNSSNDCQSYCLTGSARNFERILDMSVDGLFRAIFTEKDIKRAILELKSEIALLETRPDVVVYNAMMQEAFAIHPCRRPYYGLNPNFEGADSFILNRFYNKNYSPENTILVITGDVKIEEVVSALKKYVEVVRGNSYSEPDLPKEILQSSYREVVKYADLNKVYVSFGWKVPVVQESDKYALYVLAKLLGGNEESLLWKRLVKGRETSEFISADYETSRFQGILVVSAITSKSKVRYFIDDVRRIANGLIEERISEDVLEQTKKSIINEDIFEREGVEKAALDYGSFAVISNASDADKFENGIISVNFEDVRRVACEYLRDENLTVAILQAPPVSEDASPVMLTLDNGIKLILKENHASPVIAVSAKFLAGGVREEKRNAGISCLAGELLCRSYDNDEKTFKSKLEKIGAKLSYNACKDYVSIDMKSVSSSFIPAFDTFIRMLDKPEFPSAYSKARNVLEKELEVENKDYALLNEFNVLKAIWGNSPLTYSNYGKLDDLSKIKRADVIEYYKKNFIPSNMVVAIVGDFYASELRDYLLATLGKFTSSNKSSKEIKPQDIENIKSGTPILMKNDSDDAHIIFISRSIPSNNKSFLPFKIACLILENLLKKSFKEADQTGLMASSVEIKNNSFLNDGYFKASVKTNKENVATAAQLLNLEIEAFKISNIPLYMLQEAKESLFTQYSLELTDCMSLANVYSRDEILGLGFDYYTKFFDNLSSVTLLDVMEAAKEYMLPEKKYLIGVSSANSNDLILEDKKLIFKSQKENSISKDNSSSKDSKSSKETKDNKESSNKQENNELKTTTATSSKDITKK